MLEPLHLLTLLPIAMVDFATLFRSRRRIKNYDCNFRSVYDDFSILVPIFGNLSYLKNIDYLKHYGGKVIICTTTHESKEFNQGLEKLSSEYGFRVFKSEVPLATKKSKPNPWRLFYSTLNEKVTVDEQMVRDEIIRESFSIVTSQYCIFIDGDTYTQRHLSLLVGCFRDKGLDIASVKILPSKNNTMIEKLQTLEYSVAMDARSIYPWLTSGAGMIAKTEVIRNIMKNHSLFFSGGDIEIGKLAKLLKYRIDYIPFLFLTEVPSTFKKWFRQRRYWFGGGFRHSIINFGKTTYKSPYHLFYFSFLVYLMLPVKWYEIIQNPSILLVLFAIYCAMIVLFYLKSFHLYYLLFPIYAFIQVMIILPFGIITYMNMALQSRNLGVIKLRA